MRLKDAGGTVRACGSEIGSQPISAAGPRGQHHRNKTDKNQWGTNLEKEGRKLTLNLRRWRSRIWEGASNLTKEISCGSLLSSES